ncbi:MAG TPA: hypothetical protein DDY20_02655 [Desulfobulbaceae bacterium]|nr:hypothetical protein [Desulfobulbaceae bacterium]
MGITILKFIHIPIILSYACLHYGQVLAGNNAGAAFSTWPDTGQTTCYDDIGNVLNPCPAEGQPFYGQDAQYAGPTRSYTKLEINGNALPESAKSWAMVRDNITGLIWEAKDGRDGIQDYTNHHDADNIYTWCDTNPDTNGGNQGTCGTNDTKDFIDALNGSSFGGHTDWRLPSIKELTTLVDRSRYGPAIGTNYFPLTVWSLYEKPSYWSSTTDLFRQDKAWRINFRNGDSEETRLKLIRCHVRAVRGGQTPPEKRFVDNQDGTVTDTVTRLQWQQATADPSGDGTPDAMTWEDALAYAENLSLAGHEDWRLPDFNELASVVDYSRYDPAIDNKAFPRTARPPYWSSTTLEAWGETAWNMSFWSGGYDSQYKSYNLYMRAVRNHPSMKFFLTLSMLGSGLGSVASSPAGIDCGSDCSGTFNFGTTVTLTATASPGSMFSGWSGACSGSGSCTIQMDRHQALSAIFNKPIMPSIYELLLDQEP